MFEEVFNNMGLKFSKMIGRKYIISIRSHLVNFYGEIVEFNTDLPVVFNSYREARNYIRSRRAIGSMKIKHFKIKPYDLAHEKDEWIISRRNI